MSKEQARLVDTALSQVGYVAGASKKNKYAQELDGIGRVYNYPKNGFDWCDIFVDWCFIKTFGFPKGVEMLYQPQKSTGAGCIFSAQFYRNNKAFSNTPTVGSQIFFGAAGAESHTGIVVGTDSKYVYTVEGNTGGGNGAVKKKQYKKNNTRIVGYGTPKWSETSEKTIKEIAEEVISGKWGNGAERRRKLSQAGYDYDKVQMEVNKIITLEGMKKTKTVRQLAYEVIEGKWGYGVDRKNRLEQAGYDYFEVQNLVNRILGY